MEKFLRDSKTFSGFVFKGHYEMPISIFFIIYNHYINTGENLLDAYSKLIYLKWDRDREDFMLSYEECNIYSDYISSARKLKLFDVDKIHELKLLLKTARSNYQKHLEKIANKPRRDACSFTGNVNIKDVVFKMYGKKCLACGSEENISLDHIIPIHKKGTNTIDNLQPLCKSCNSKKGTKIIDYRKEIL